MTNQIPPDTREALQRILPSLQELIDSLHEAIYMGMADASFEMTIEIYRFLHAKVVRLLPEDEFITKALVLRLPKNADPDQLTGVVNIATRQLVKYLLTEYGLKRPPKRKDDDEEEEDEDNDEKSFLKKAIRDE